MNENSTKYLNLGCGNRYHPAWINIDISTQAQGVMQHDLSRGIPLADSSCDVVYNAAMLEHLRRSDAEAFLAECYRVVKPGGIVRVGVPDLEQTCQIYLSSLAAALTGDAAGKHDYDWMMQELFDQTVREKSGGGMLDYLRQNPLLNEAFVYERIGEEGRQFVKTLRELDCSNQVDSKLSNPAFHARLIKGVRSLPSIAKRRLIKLLLGSNDNRALEIGRFRLAGEVHQWMYDRYSLARLLSLTGFLNPRLQDAKTSQIPNWVSFNLDTLPDGRVIKPDLFFMEAIKP